MAAALYLDTSSVLRAILEEGTTPSLERAIGAARTLITSRLSLVEAARALIRLRATGLASEVQLADTGTFDFPQSPAHAEGSFLAELALESGVGLRMSCPIFRNAPKWWAANRILSRNWKAGSWSCNRSWNGFGT